MLAFVFMLTHPQIRRLHSRWGGSPVDLEYNDAIVEGSDVYIDELRKAIEERGLKLPPFYGLALDDESVDMDKILADFEEFIQKICG